VTDTATAPEASVLTPFDGTPVLAAGMEIPGAAGGLREALRIAPEEFHKGEERYVVLKVVMKKVRHDPLPKTEAWERVHIFECTGATFVDGDLVREKLDEQAARIEAARIEAEKAKGIERLPYDGFEDDVTAVLTRQHASGAHADGLREGCPTCQEELDALAEEAGG
jgi:hypothetical protein